MSKPAEKTETRLMRYDGDKGAYEAKPGDMMFGGHGKSQRRGRPRKKGNRARRHGKKQGGEMQAAKDRKTPG